MNTKTEIYLVSAMLTALIMTGCADKKIQRGPEPDWVRQGKHSLDDSGRTALYGIGSADARITNRPFKRMTADERARVDLAYAIHETVTNAIKQAMSDTAGDHSGIVESVALAATEDALSHWRVIHRYEDDKGMLHSLATVQMDKVSEAMKIQIKLQAGSSGLDSQALMQKLADTRDK